MQDRKQAAAAGHTLNEKNWTETGYGFDYAAPANVELKKKDKKQIPDWILVSNGCP